MSKVIIAGGRNFNNYELLKSKVYKILCDDLLDEYRFSKLEIVSGCARGADTLGEQFAKQYGIPIKQFPANWDKYGKSAGYRRNREMAEYADVLIAFWDGQSRGTKHMIDLATNMNLKVHLIMY